MYFISYKNTTWSFSRVERRDAELKLADLILIEADQIITDEAMARAEDQAYIILVGCEDVPGEPYTDNLIKVEMKNISR